MKHYGNKPDKYSRTRISTETMVE